MQSMINAIDDVFGAIDWPWNFRNTTCHSTIVDALTVIINGFQCLFSSFNFSFRKKTILWSKYLFSSNNFLIIGKVGERISYQSNSSEPEVAFGSPGQA